MHERSPQARAFSRGFAASRGRNQFTGTAGAVLKSAVTLEQIEINEKRDKLYREKEIR